MTDTTTTDSAAQTEADHDAQTPGFDVDYRAGAGRDACKRARRRKHDDYRKPHWATCHVDDVDSIFAAASDDGGPCERGDPQVRIDLDGVGSPRASLHGAGENINLSIWISREQIDELVDALEEAREDGENRWWVDDEEGGR